MTKKILNFLITQGLNQTTSEYITSAIMFLFILIMSILACRVFKTVILKALKIIIKKSKPKWADLLLEYNFFRQFTIIIPALIIYALSSMLIHGQVWVKRFAFCVVILGLVRIIGNILDAFNNVYSKTEASKTRPIKGLIQIIKIITYVVGTIIIISVLTNRSPAILLGSVGAASAILLLVFQNTILGFVASIQLTENDMIRIGDWIEMPSHNADGDVVEISLHSVKVINWDKTITTIPTHNMITESFKNWRNMQQTGGRRIKRSFFIDMTSVHFCTQEMLEKYEKIQYIKQYLIDKTNEIQEYNDKNEIDFSSLVNGRRLTNIGTFRAYLDIYLKKHPKIHPDLMILVRHLEPTEHGLPIELYFFTNTTKWIEYESIQADIFDHILAIIPEFDLQVYQRVSGNVLLKP